MPAAAQAVALKLVERVRTGVEVGESHIREFKSALSRENTLAVPRDPKHICKDIAETLVAFANADGGELYVGVEDDGAISGVLHKDAIVEMLLNAPSSHVHPRTPLPNPIKAKISIDGKIVLFFQVAKSTTTIHETSDGRCLQRFDRENRPVPFEDIQYGRQERISREYDRQFVDGAGLGDLNLELVDRCSKLIGGGQSPEKFLQYLDLAEYEASGLVLRKAALLLFEGCLPLPSPLRGPCDPSVG